MVNGHNSPFSGRIAFEPLKNKTTVKNQDADAIKAATRDTKTISFERMKLNG